MMQKEQLPYTIVGVVLIVGAYQIASAIADLAHYAQCHFGW